MAKKTTKRKTVKTRNVKAKRVARVTKTSATRASTVFKQPMAVLQESLNAVVNYFK